VPKKRVDRDPRLIEYEKQEVECTFKPFFETQKIKNKEKLIRKPSHSKKSSDS